MAATNAALAWGGMTHCCLSHGLRSFFLAPATPSPGRWPRPPPTRPTGRPTPSWSIGLPLGGRRAGQGHQPGLLPAVELAVLPVGRPLLVQRRVQAFGGELLPHAGDGHAADAQGGGDALVGPGVGA